RTLHYCCLAASRHWKRLYFAERVFPSKVHDIALDTKRDPTVWRRTEIKGLKHMSRVGFNILLVHTHHRIGCSQDLLIVRANGAPARFKPVTDDVILRRKDLAYLFDVSWVLTSPD